MTVFISAFIVQIYFVKIVGVHWFIKKIFWHIIHLFFFSFKKGKNMRFRHKCTVQFMGNILWNVLTVVYEVSSWIIYTEHFLLQFTNERKWNHCLSFKSKRKIKTTSSGEEVITTMSLCSEGHKMLKSDVYIRMADKIFKRNFEGSYLSKNEKKICRKYCLICPILVSIKKTRQFW